MPPKETLQSGSVVLPTFPKYDEKDRKKWALEYDKVESELLKPHLAAPGQPSAVVSLRNANLNFDRHIPAPGDPTLSEQYEMLRKKKRPGALDKLPPRAQSTDPAGSTFISNIMHASADMSALQPAHLSSNTKDSGVDGSRGSRISPLRKRPTSAKLPVSIVSTLPLGHGHQSPHRSPSPTSMITNGADSSSLTAASVADAVSVADMSKIVRYLLEPPVDYKSSFNLNLSGIDLRWMLSFRSGDRIPDTFTLETLREDLFTNPAAANSAALNSPRSAYVLLRNGISVDDLQIRPHSYFVDRTGTSDHIVAMRFSHYELRRKYLLQALRTEYRTLCSTLPLYDILEEFLATGGSGGNGSSGGVDVSFIQERRSRIQKVQEKNKIRLEKQMEYVADLQNRSLSAEEKRLAAEKELQHRREKLRSENESRLAQAAKRAEQLRQSTTALTEMFMQQAAERQRKLEEKERQQQEAQEIKAQQRREARERKAKMRAERQQLNKELLERKFHEEEAKRLEREAVAREKLRQQQIREELERDEAERHKKAVEEARNHARLRVEQQLEEANAKARLREAESAKRLQEFEESRRQQREALREAEAEKNRKRRLAAMESNNTLEKHKNEIMRKREEAESRFHHSIVSKQHEDETANEVQHISGGDKLFFVSRRTNAQEFNKLVSICKILTKKETAEAISRQREALLNATLRDREALRLEKERAQKELEKKMRMLPIH